MSADDYKKKSSLQPPVVFERAVNVYGVAQHYKYPRGLSAEEFDIEFFNEVIPIQHDEDKYRNLLSVRFNELAALNPAVEPLRHDELRRLRYAIFGIASSMNVSDIKYFCEFKERTGKAEVAMESLKMPPYYALNAAIERRTGFADGWVMSPETMVFVLDQVMDRPEIYDVQTPEQWKPEPERRNYPLWLARII